MNNKARQSVYWPEVYAGILQCCHQCITCNNNAPSRRAIRCWGRRTCVSLWICLFRLLCSCRTRKIEKFIYMDRYSLRLSVMKWSLRPSLNIFGHHSQLSQFWLRLHRTVALSTWAFLHSSSWRHVVYTFPYSNTRTEFGVETVKRLMRERRKRQAS